MCVQTYPYGHVGGHGTQAVALAGAVLSKKSDAYRPFSPDLFSIEPVYSKFYCSS